MPVLLLQQVIACGLVVITKLKDPIVYDVNLILFTSRLSNWRVKIKFSIWQVVAVSSGHCIGLTFTKLFMHQHVLFSCPVCAAEEASPADSQLQAVYREVLFPNQSGRPRSQGDRPHSLSPNR